jgi:bacteriorhodopsin
VNGISMDTTLFLGTIVPFRVTTVAHRREEVLQFRTLSFIIHLVSIIYPMCFFFIIPKTPLQPPFSNP